MIIESTKNGNIQDISQEGWAKLKKLGFSSNFKVINGSDDNLRSNKIAFPSEVEEIFIKDIIKPIKKTIIKEKEIPLKEVKPRRKGTQKNKEENGKREGSTVVADNKNVKQDR